MLQKKNEKKKKSFPPLENKDTLLRGLGHVYQTTHWYLNLSVHHHLSMVGESVAFANNEGDIYLSRSVELIKGTDGSRESPVHV